MHHGDQEQVLRRLPWLLAERLEEAERAQQQVREAVRDLVLAGYSWADVGRMLGVTRQAARQRFGSEVDWWREHMGDRLPWEDWADQLAEADAPELLDALMAQRRLSEAGPVEDLR